MQWPGDMGDQPAFYIEAIRVCEDEARAMQTEEAERHEQELKRQQAEAQRSGKGR